MTFFESNIPTIWLCVNLYIIGVLWIGLPFGYYSLKMWKNPKDFSVFVGRILFPMNSITGNIGNHYYDVDDMSDNLPITMSALDIHDALKLDNHSALNKYLALQMLFWPLRLIYTIGMLVLNLILFLMPKPAG